jgi:hypothetical protein
MKAGCFYICFQVAEPGEDARCCNIPKLNEEFESFSGAKARVLKFVRVRIHKYSFCVELPPLAGSAPTQCVPRSVEWSDECCFCLHLYIHSKLTVHQGMMCTTRGT